MIVVPSPSRLRFSLPSEHLLLLLLVFFPPFLPPCLPLSIIFFHIFSLFILFFFPVLILLVFLILSSSPLPRLTPFSLCISTHSVTCRNLRMYVLMHEHKRSYALITVLKDNVCCTSGNPRQQYKWAMRSLPRTMARVFVAFLSFLAEDFSLFFLLALFTL